MLSRVVWAAPLFLLVLAACQPVTPPTAVLSVDGPDVRLNGVPAETGDPVGPGDRVSTGAHSAARIGWSLDDSMIVDERSDPLYHWTGPDGRTLAINVGVGWFLIDAGTWHVRVDNEIATVAIGSRACFNVVPGRYLDVFLFEGTATVVHPAALTLASGEKVRISAEGTVTADAIQAADRAAVEARFGRWNLPAISPPRPNRQ